MTPCRLTYRTSAARTTDDTSSPRASAATFAASHNSSGTRTFRAVVATSTPHSGVLARQAVTPRRKQRRVRAAATLRAGAPGAHRLMLPAQHRGQVGLVVGDDLLSLRHTHNRTHNRTHTSRGL